jgi:hypothetical protein
MTSFESGICGVIGFTAEARTANLAPNAPDSQFPPSVTAQTVPQARWQGRCGAGHDAAAGPAIAGARGFRAVGCYRK